jgi:hypothetical protein
MVKANDPGIAIKYGVSDRVLLMQDRGLPARVYLVQILRDDISMSLLDYMGARTQK